MADKNWYVLKVRKGWEKKVIKQLSHSAEYFIPCYRTSNHSRRSVQVNPLFESYLFVKTHYSNCMDLKKLPGVINVLYWMSAPAVIPEKEINLLKSFLEENNFLRLNKAPIDTTKEAAISIADEFTYKAQAYKPITKTLLLPNLGYSIVATTHKAQVRVIHDVAEKQVRIDENMLSPLAVSTQ